MTTKVVVDAHAGWPVKVVFEHKDVTTRAWSFSREQVVAPMTKETIAVWDSQRIIVEEMKRSE